MSMIFPVLDPAELAQLQRHSRAEATVYLALQQLEMAGLEVYHSLNYRGREGFGEMDFVLLHPDLGLMIWEVKGGGVGRRDGRWFSVDRHGREHAIHDPLSQLGRAQNALLQQIQQQINSPTAADPLQLPIGRHLILPDLDDTDLSTGLGSGLDRADLVLKSDLTRLDRERLRALFERTGNYRHKLPLRPRHLELLRQRVLRPSFRLLPGFAPVHEQTCTRLIRLSAQQSWALRMLEHIPRVMIDGGAGTGKSLLACEKVRQLASAGKRVLLLCFNLALAEALRSSLNTLEPAPWVGTFHEFCQERAGQTGLSWAVPTGFTEQSHFYIETAAELLDEAQQRCPVAFDGLIVDEGQDFAAHWWLPLAESLNAQAPVYVFSDPHQNVFERAWERPSACFEGMIPYPFQLLHNVRNCREIAQWLKARFVYAGDPPASAPESGLAVREHRYRSAQQQTEQMQQALRQLQAAGIDETEVVILSLYRANHSQGYQGLRQQQEFKGRFSTIGAFKGLHAKAVLLCDWNTSDHARREDLLYVGASRAQLALHIFSKAP
ncbi:NERD domain-containing protein [Desulfuromonas thiophila]|uniref:Nuclease-related domain-containing protein n=1 Tax=Desulfuromonas thiophila TaxID=57664 RepID=A0A1G7DXP1_9BACT|nr:NERD domain-containing protein [Desulfuromonas thiophila]SDE56228.1 Nuclease-related domain-containing protein [Desulfuromonas thiophila]